VTKRFADKLVLVTGAAGGMGRAFAHRFADEGARLVLTDIDASGLEQAATALRGRGADCSTHGVDLASEAEIQRFAADISHQHPRLDVLVNNAGIAYGEITHAFQGLTQGKWLHFLSVNALSPLILAQALRPALAKGPGVIVNVTSMASNVPATAYGVTKATLNAITFGMANAFAADGIRVNAVAPGVMETPAAREQLPPETYTRIQSQQLLNLHGTANDVAALAAFLASDDARFINCEIVSCDAGNRIRGWRG
jgi:3-oxoacyl-[acyl-carrier protein] reductase